MPTLLKLKDWMLRCANESTPIAKTFATGEMLDLNNLQYKPILVWLEQPNRITTRLNPHPIESVWSVQFKVLDQCKEQDVDRDNILSKAVAIGNAMIAWLSTHQYDDNAPFKIADNTSVDCVTLWRTGADNWAGARFELQLRSAFTSDGCDVL